MLNTSPGMLKQAYFNKIDLKRKYILFGWRWWWTLTGLGMIKVQHIEIDIKLFILYQIKNHTTIGTNISNVELVQYNTTI